MQRFRLASRRNSPPPCPSGWTVGPPDFVGVGAQRAGTTWWYHLLESHPGVVERSEKELHFLRKYWQRPFTDEDTAAYASYFPRPEGKLAGEWSPGYVSHFWVPPILRRVAPDAALLLLVRDPVERYLSGLVLQHQTGRPSAAGASRAFRLGCYSSHLEHLLRYFPREQVLVLQLERCVREPGAELARSYRFLGLDDTFVPRDLTQRRNESRDTKPELHPDTRAALVAAYEPEVLGLKNVVNDLDLGLWANFAHLA